jgi:hypothetical protein
MEREREREREREKEKERRREGERGDTQRQRNTYIHTYILIYKYKHNECSPPPTLNRPPCNSAPPTAHQVGGEPRSLAPPLHPAAVRLDHAVQRHPLKGLPEDP